MLTKGRIKSIQQLHEKKYRSERGLFLVEGEKSVAELLTSDFKIEEIYGTAHFRNSYQHLLNKKSVVFNTVEPQELQHIGTLESNNGAVAIVRQKPQAQLPSPHEGIVLAVDAIRDPGNLGTIIRIADWYGITHIIASPSTTDFYNSKTIAATMGSFTRVHVIYKDIASYIIETNAPSYGAFLDGKDAHTTQFPSTGILVIGNESHGISPHVASVIQQKITIPSYGKAESLNASIATAIILDNWKRSLSSLE